MNLEPTRPNAFRDLPSGACPDDAAPAENRSSGWEQVARDHAATVYRIAYHLTGDVHDAQDLSQDVFARAFRSLDSTTLTNVEGWLYRITLNLFRDQIRRSRRLWFEPLGSDTVERRRVHQPTPEDVLLDNVLSHDVGAAVAALPADQRIPILLRDVVGMSYEGIAAMLGVPRGTVASRISRGHARLRAALAHRAPAARRVATSTSCARAAA